MSLQKKMYKNRPLTCTTPLKILCTDNVYTYTKQKQPTVIIIYKRSIAITECFKINTTIFLWRDNTHMTHVKIYEFSMGKKWSFCNRKKLLIYLVHLSAISSTNTTMIYYVWINVWCIIIPKLKCDKKKNAW